jgi:hypothetical protein
MAPMVSTLSWCLRGCALVVATALLAGCSRVVAGVPQPLSGVGETGPPVPVADLLIDPSGFPAHYPAAVLDDGKLHRVLQDIDGVPAGWVVSPPDCAPPELKHAETAAVEGVDSASAGRLIVVVTRPAPELSSRVEQLRGCASFTARRGEDTSAVKATLMPAPPVDADDTYAVDQTVTTSGSERRMLTLAAQIGDTRVSATWLQEPAVDEPDTTSLDTLFSDAVLNVRRGK